MRNTPSEIALMELERDWAQEKQRFKHNVGFGERIPSVTSTLIATLVVIGIVYVGIKYIFNFANSARNIQQQIAQDPWFIAWVLISLLVGSYPLYLGILAITEIQKSRQYQTAFKKYQAKRDQILQSQARDFY